MSISAFRQCTCTSTCDYIDCSNHYLALLIVNSEGSIIPGSSKVVIEPQTTPNPTDHTQPSRPHPTQQTTPNPTAQDM